MAEYYVQPGIVISRPLEAQSEVDGDEYSGECDGQHGPLYVWERPLAWVMGMAWKTGVSVGTKGGAGGQETGDQGSFHRISGCVRVCENR